jgi:diaminopimelate decarboxylase
MMAVLGLVREAGCALEVNSEGELWKARRAGFADDAIVLNGVAKSRSEIAAAIDPPIKAINVDSVFELARIRDVAAEEGKRANVALRLVPELESGTAPGTETASSRTKFGMTVDQLGPALELLRAGKAELKLVGLHVHVGSQITDRSTYAEAGRFIAAQAREVEGALGERLAHFLVKHEPLDRPFPRAQRPPRPPSQPEPPRAPPRTHRSAKPHPSR